MPGTRAQAERFADLFGAVYLAFHRRDAPRSELTGASRAVLTHLALAGPLTVGEATGHLQRAQSVVSEIVDRLESHGLLERETDPDDRRRTLVWLTEAGHELLRDDRRVLSAEHVERAVAALPADQVEDMLAGLSMLIDQARPARPLAVSHPHHTQGDDHELDPDL